MILNCIADSLCQPPKSPLVILKFTCYAFHFKLIARSSWVWLEAECYSLWCCCTADISQSQITWLRKHTMIQSFLGLWMTLPLSTFGTALHLLWCLNPTVLLRESLTVTVSIALMFCSRSSLKFQLRSSLWFRAHTQKKSFNRYSECPWYIARFLQKHCGGKNTRSIVYIYSFHQGLCWSYKQAQACWID